MPAHAKVGEAVQSEDRDPRDSSVSKRRIADSQPEWVAIMAMLVYGGTGAFAYAAGRPIMRLKVVALIAGLIMLIVKLVVDRHKRSRSFGNLGK